MESTSRSGYEHRYRVSKGHERKEEGCPKVPYRTYMLEVRTNFILKRITPTGAREILIDTERFGYRLKLDDPPLQDMFGPAVLMARSLINTVDYHIRGRLRTYCMSDAQIRGLAQAAFDIVHRLSEEPQYRTIPAVLVSIDVCTVQLEGEPLDATIDRSVKPDFLIPLQLQLDCTRSRGPNFDLPSYLSRRPIVRVREDDDHNDDFDEEGFLARVHSCPICLNKFSVCFQIRSPAQNYAFHQTHSVSRKEGLSLMEVCPICLREPIVGAEITSLPCKHAFHQHCVARWLHKSKSCPVCHVKIVFKLDYRKFFK